MLIFTLKLSVISAIWSLNLLSYFVLFQIRLCFAGLWRIVTIDDRVPTNSVSGKAAFSTARRRQAWTLLVEKVRCACVLLFCGHIFLLENST